MNKYKIKSGFDLSQKINKLLVWEQTLKHLDGAI